MYMSISDIRQIYEALDREPVWKLVLLETSVDAFREWLRRVLPAVFTRICESAEDMLWRVLG
jgi:hypothetical protein